MPERNYDKRILVVASNIHRAVSFEWIANELKNRGYSVHFALLNKDDSALEDFLIENQVPVIKIIYRNKFDIPRAIISLVRFIKQNKINIVHAHLLEGGIAGMAAARLCGISKRVYTRHHSNFHHKYYPKVVKYDRFINWLATDIVAPSQIVKEILIQEKTPERKIHVIHHGIKSSYFRIVEEDKVEGLRKKYKIYDEPVIGVISRWVESKGIQYLIPAFKNFINVYPNAKLILANAKGNHRQIIQDLLNGLPTKNFEVITFEEDVAALYKLFDIFVHIPIDPESEAFGQVYIEALASGIPSIFTISGVIGELSDAEEHALIIPHQNSDKILEGLKLLTTDKERCQRMKINGSSLVQKDFGLEDMINKLDTIYRA